MRAFLILVFTLIFNVTNAAYAENVIRITSGEWKPYLSVELPDHGLYAIVTRKAFEKVGVEVEFGFFPWNRARRLVEEGRWDASLIWVATSERRQKFLFPDAIITHPEVLYYNKDYPLTVKSLEDFHGLTMGLMHSSALGSQFKDLVDRKLLKVSHAPTNEHLFQMLYAGRVDFIPEFLTSGQEAIDALPATMDESKITHLKDFQYDRVFHLIISRQIEKGPYFTDKFNEGLKLLKSSGEFDDILQSHLKPAS